MQITAALSRGLESPFSCEPVELDRPGPGEILVRTVATGICHTDLLFSSIPPGEAGPIVLGHEGAGVVDAVGPGVHGIEPGDHVLLSYRRCGGCRSCRAGRPTYCTTFAELNSSGARLDGSTPLSQDGKPVRAAFFGQSSFATHCLATVDNTVVVDRSLDLTVLAPFTCGFQTGAGAVLNVLQPGDASSFVVYGAGAVGLAALLAARDHGVGTIVAVEPVAGRRDLALKLGATAVVDPGADDVVAAVRSHTSGGSSHALDTTGAPLVLRQALTALGPGGALVAVGLGAPDVTIDIIDIIGGGKTLRGCIEGDADPYTFLPRLIDLYSAGRFPVDELVARYPFPQIGAAVEASVSGAVVKPVLVF